MIAWFRPWMAWAALVLVLGAALGFQTLQLESERKTLAELREEVSQERLEHTQALLAAEATARDNENKLRGDLDAIQAAARKDNENAKAREDALVERIRTGERRLSIAARCPAGGGTKAGADPAAASGGGPEVSRAELDPAAGIALVGIARDGDRAIRERNACVAAYEAVRQRVNGDGEQPGQP